MVSPSITRVTRAWKRFAGFGGLTHAAAGREEGAAARETRRAVATANTRIYRTTNAVSKVPCLPPAEQVMMMGHLPGVVRVPTRHVHVTLPLLSALCGKRPRARLGPDL
jgi:hypothetical protein